MMHHDADIPTPLESYRGQVLPEWIDFNGHMNVAYYVLAFDQATEAACDYFRLDETYRKTSQCSTFTLELHVNYHREILEGETFQVKSYLLGADAKRIHLFHEMYHAGSDELVATNENMMIHIDMQARRSTPFPAELRVWLETVAAAHAKIPRPANAGRSIGLPG